MSRPLPLPDFTPADLDRDAAQAAHDDAQRQTGFEAGYAAGWDDSLAAQTDERLRRAQEVSQNLQALAFTHAEARAHVMRAMSPLLAELLGKVLPALARENLGAILQETLLPLAARLADAPISLRIAPDAREDVEAALQEATLPLSITEDPSLTGGAAWLMLGEITRHIDLDEAIAAMRAALAETPFHQDKVYRHG